MKARSIHPGVDPAELRAATGFDAGPLDGVPLTPEPDARSLDLLRNEIDPRRILIPKLD